MSQKLSVNIFKWVEDISEFAGTFIKSYNEESDEGYFLEVKKLNILKIYIKPKTIFHLPEGMKIERAEKLVANLHEKTEYFVHIRNLYHESFIP